MADISPRMSPRMAQIFAALQANPDGELGALDLVMLGTGANPANFSPAVHAWPDGFLSALYPKLDPGPTTASSGEWIEIISLLYTQYFQRFQQRDVTFFETKFPIIAASTVIAKAQLTGTIGRASQGAAIVPALVRPVTVYANGGTAVENWIKTSVAAGWTTPLFTINLNANGSTLNIQPQNRVVMLVMGAIDAAASPKWFEYQWKNAAAQPLGVRSAPLQHALGDLAFLEFDESVLIQKTQTYTLDVNFDSTGSSIPELLGIQYQTPDYATAE